MERHRRRPEYGIPLNVLDMTLIQRSPANAKDGERVSLTSVEANIVSGSIYLRIQNWLVLESVQAFQALEFLDIGHRGHTYRGNEEVAQLVKIIARGQGRCNSGATDFEIKVQKTNDG